MCKHSDVDRWVRVPGRLTAVVRIAAKYFCNMIFCPCRSWVGWFAFALSCLYIIDTVHFICSFFCNSCLTPWFKLKFIVGKIIGRYGIYTILNFKYDHCWMKNLRRFSRNVVFVISEQENNRNGFQDPCCVVRPMLSGAFTHLVFGYLEKCQKEKLYLEKNESFCVCQTFDAYCLIT